MSEPGRQALDGGGSGDDSRLAAAMVENLVTQFRSALDFYRELVQNSIDAGSPRVDVWTEFLPSEEGTEGTIAIHVDDFGDGMDESIIDSELTQLFASSKDDDLTKIGKFGIGFVSVFALDPKAVLVHTGRVGEYWEVYFGEDRTFVKTRLEQPVEGTQVTLFVAGDHQRYVELVRGSLDTLRKWCVHSETEVTFEDRSASLRGERSEVVTINRPFDLDGRCVTRNEEPGTTIAVAWSDAPEWGFYNRGLALLRTRAFEAAWDEGLRRELGPVAVKIKSRYLEHTLTRETVLRDEHYEKAVERVLEVVRGPLRQALVDELVELAASPDIGTADLGRYASGIELVSTWPVEGLDRHAREPILRALHGPPVSLEQVARSAWQHGRVYLAEQPNAATEDVHELGGLVVVGHAPGRSAIDLMLGPDGQPVLGGVRRLLSRWMDHAESSMATWRGWPAVTRELAEYASALAKAVYTADGRHLTGTEWRRRRVAEMLASPDALLIDVDAVADLPAAATRLLEHAEATLAATPARYDRIAPGRVVSTDAPLFVVGDEVRRRMLVPPRRAVLPARRPAVVVNVEHPHFVQLLEVARHSPSLAAYCLSKSLLLDEDRLLELDAELMVASHAAAGGEA